jgi:hypothetical protein
MLGNDVFSPPELKKPMIDKFVPKVSSILKEILLTMGKGDLNIKITVRHKASKSSHWHTFYIDKVYVPNKAAELKRKDHD